VKNELLPDPGQDREGSRLRLHRRVRSDCSAPNSQLWANVEAANRFKPYMTAVLQGGDPQDEAKVASEKISEQLAGG
jgi:hypothetical protein